MTEAREVKRSGLIPALDRLSELLKTFGAILRRCATTPLRYAQQINSGVTEWPKPEA